MPTDRDFGLAGRLTPTALRGLEIKLSAYTNPSTMTDLAVEIRAKASIHVLDQNGRIMETEKSDNIRSLLTSAEKVQLLAIIQKVWDAAGARILPAP